MIFVFAFLFLLALISLCVFLLKSIKKDISVPEIFMAIVYISSIGLFFIGLLMHSNDYYKAIDPVDGDCYIPFGGKHIITLIFYFIAFNVSFLLIWIRGHELPPLTKVLSFGFIIIGVILSVLILLQLSKHDTTSIDMYSKSDHVFYFVPAPFFSIFISILTVVYVVKEGILTANDRTYSNKTLAKLNHFLAKKSNSPVWIIILTAPLLLLVTAILILFGQDSNSLVKVFTETATWRFSQHLHPPILDHKGHYLCTVAASGDPKIVKPLRFGKRYGNTIIVNRQLLIANAFEEMVQDFSPRLHRFIRRNYDKYGYNLSKKINNQQMSNLTYILMKPLEWGFLVSLYLFCPKPEQKINKQYQG